MAPYQLTDEAEADLEAIAEYTYRRFGIVQAERYRDALIECFGMLAEHPQVGQDVSFIRQGAKRHAHQEHVVYYRPSSPVLILRVLGGAQDPLKQFAQEH